MKILKFTLSFLFIISYLEFNGQHTIYVEEWVNQPNEEDFQKPLIVLDFWATWCGPCINAMDQTERVLSQFDEDVLLVYNSDEPSLTVQKFMEKKEKNFFSLVDGKQRNSESFKVSSLPSTFILNPEGEVIWKGFPTDITPSLLQKFLKKYKGNKVITNRFVTDAPKELVYDENFSEYKAKGIEIEFTKSNTYSYFLEDLQPDFYFNGDLNSLIAFLYDIPEKNIQNLSSNTDFYTLQCKYDKPENFKKALAKFIKKELEIDIDEEAKMMETFVLRPSENLNFYDTSVYDFAESKSKYLASDMDVEIDNESVAGMVSILNKFSEYHFDAEGFDKVPHDWNVHFKYNELTLEQLEHDLNINIEKEDRLVQFLVVKDR